jgi:hypothetical protein
MHKLVGAVLSMSNRIRFVRGLRRRQIYGVLSRLIVFFQQRTYLLLHIRCTHSRYILDASSGGP